jgi:hypothetical protein
MPTLDDVYRKFGMVAEAAQLLETDLGTILLFLGAVDGGLISPTLEADGKRVADLLRLIDRQTMGQLIRNNQRLSDLFAPIESLLDVALDERNRLSHSFYRQHNLRRNSDTGRAIMLDDLESMHDTLLTAWKAVSRLLGVDLDKVADEMAKRDHQRYNDLDDGGVVHLQI